MVRPSIYDNLRICELSVWAYNVLARLRLPWLWMSWVTVRATTYGPSILSRIAWLTGSPLRKTRHWPTGSGYSGVSTVRPAEGWYESASATLSEALAPQPAAVRLLAWQGLRRRGADDDLAKANDDFQQRTWEREVGGHFTDRDRAIAAFDKHVADVRAHIPAGRLLVYSVRDGWGPLCAFLGVSEPEEPFPRENDRATFRRRQQVALSQVLIPRVLALAAIATGLALAAWGHRLVRRSRSSASPSS